MITTETKRYENGLMRVVGLSKWGYSGMILLQAVLFVIPSITLGFLTTIPMLAFIYGKLFTSEMGFEKSVWPSGTACLQALAIGLIIPLFSAILPIKIALSKTLSETLNTVHSTAGSVISIHDNKAIQKAPYITMGLITCVFGSCIYYILPLALISGSFKLILNIFFLLIVGLLSGLTLLASNL